MTLEDDIKYLDYEIENLHIQVIDELSKLQDLPAFTLKKFNKIFQIMKEVMLILSNEKI